MAKGKAKAPAKRRARPTARKPAAAVQRRRRLAILGGVTLFVIAVRLFVLEGYRISASSMEDSLLEGDVVLVERLSFGSDWFPDLSSPAPGDVVVFRRPEDGGVMIKRCVAIAGQRVQIKNKILYVDSERALDPPRSKYLDAAIQPAEDGSRDHFGPAVVPPGHIFVLGDNRDASQDSRFFGPVAEPLLIGRAIAVLWPRILHGVD
ncbi:MAG: signal peptidase I [Gemmatimonadetes bacterium]|jgi:signal peptidase I|nr:signal peptidase I [Gemmatimonadota bacterium]MBT7861110.1 signal peptidase I [Gemmatimonadota bacterium]